MILDMVDSTLRYSAPHATLDVVKQSVQYEASVHGAQLSERVLEIISVTIFTKREELRAVLTEMILRQSSENYLVDYNYNVELCLASGSMSKVMEPLLVLELVLREGAEGSKTRRVVLEMNLKESQKFVGELHRVDRELAN